MDIGKNIAKIRDEFPVLKYKTYMNSAAHGPVLRRVWDAVQDFWTFRMNEDPDPLIPDAKGEAAKLNIYDTPLYWRVRAADRNEVHGSWTGAGEFQVNKPFSMPAWAIFTVAGIAVVFTFLIGYWVGRRAASYR